MTAWLNSPGHRANIENASYRAIGVGAAANAGRRALLGAGFRHGRRVARRHHRLRLRLRLRLRHLRLRLRLHLRLRHLRRPRPGEP